MNTYEIDPKEVDAQIDLHLKRVPKKFIPAYFDFDDFRQNIYLALLVRAANYDPARSTKKTFQDRVIRQCIARFILSLRWKKYKSVEGVACEERSTDLVLNEVKLGELKIAEQHVFAGEVQTVIDGMDDELKEICGLLKYYTLTETASFLGVRRNKIHRGIKRIRDLMERAGVQPGNFLEFE